MRAALAAFASGLLFGLGLAVARMVDPAKVLGFLDVAGDWDPSLMLVLGGATGTSFVTFRLILRRPAPLLEPRWSVPAISDIDLPLVAGAAVFGVGWGLAGLCPGPGIASLAFGAPYAFVFVAAMLAGALLAPRLPRRPPAEDG